MHPLGMGLPASYQIAGFHLVVQKEHGASPVFCPHVMDAFSLCNPVKQADFTLTIQAVCPVHRPMTEQQLRVTSNGVTMWYGTESEHVYLESDVDLKHWNLHTTYGDGNIDEWFDKVGNLFAWAVPGKGAFVLHGVILEWQGKGIILTAASGTGKSTHARLWREYENALIINGDRTLLRKEHGRWYAYGTPWSGSSGECVNRRISLDAIVFLARGNANEASRIAPLNAMEKMFPRMIAPKWHPAYSANAVDLAINCLEEVPLFELHCRPDADSVSTLKKALLDAI